MQANNKRIAKNTLMLYFRQMITMLVNLYSVRVILNTLGVEDYGIYIVIAGVTTMFAFLNGTMSNATQRFFSYALGKGNTEYYNKIFCMSLNIYLIVVLISIVLLETIGLWFVNTKLVIPVTRIEAAAFLYQFVILSFVLNIFTTTYISIILSQERMAIFAVMSVFDAILKLVIIFCLGWFSFDKLKLYAVLLFGVSVIHLLLYIVMCNKQFKQECRYNFVWDTKLFKEITGYSGWTILGTIAIIVRTHGVNILLNLFYGPLVNAARGIAYQVNNAIVAFSQNFSIAMKPQMIKLYAENNNQQLLSLVFQGTKIIYYLMFLLTLPVFLEAPYILNLWLKETPDFTVLFVRLILIEALIDSLRYPLQNIAFATGKIRAFQIMVSGTLILVLPVSYLFLKLGFSPQTPMIIGIIISIIALFWRLVIINRLIDFPVKRYCKLILTQILILSVLAMIIPITLKLLLQPGFIRFIVICSISVVVWIAIIYFGGLNKAEKNMIKKKATQIFRHKYQ
jgi:O-antigen/teichoic acid export membrane protein